jgi:hypothetical protein
MPTGLLRESQSNATHSTGKETGGRENLEVSQPRSCSCHRPQFMSGERRMSVQALLRAPLCARNIKMLIGPINSLHGLGDHTKGSDHHDEGCAQQCGRVGCR